MSHSDLPPGVRAVSAGWRPTAALVRAALVSAVLAAYAGLPRPAMASSATSTATTARSGLADLAGI